jgi:hypothetical protein
VTVSRRIPLEYLTLFVTGGQRRWVDFFNDFKSEEF